MASNNKVFLLVCEGPTDIEIIKAISDKISEITGSGIGIDIRELSPVKDQTSGNYPSHGWTEVKSWCERYSIRKQIVVSDDMPTWEKELASKARANRWDVLLNAANADGLIIQLDTDIAEEMTHDIFSPANIDRRTFCENAINHWLSESDKPNKMFYVLPTFSSETWLLASHEPEIHTNYETIQDVETRLIPLGYKTKLKNGRPRLKKIPRFYRAYSERMVSKLDIVRGRCSECDNFCKFLEEKIEVI